MSKKTLTLLVFAAAAFCAGADDIKIPAVYTVPHELDCLIKAGHIQGACCSEKAIYLSHQLGIFKVGWDGKLIKSVEAPAHLGDSAYADGKIYGAFVIRNKAMRKNGKQGLVRVWDEDLNVLREAWFDEALDGIAVIGDTVYVGVDRWGHGKHDGCCIKRLTKDLVDRGNVDLDLGYQIHYGVQTMATDGTDLFLGNYGGTTSKTPSRSPWAAPKGSGSSRSQSRNATRRSSSRSRPWAATCRDGARIP